MVTELEGLEEEVINALSCIQNNESFVISGGAGSGKTYSLISLIKEVLKQHPTKTIVCITYTNNAVHEIRSRINSDKLNVSTIHEFLWKLINKYQNEIKKILVDLINDDSVRMFYKPRDIETFTLEHLRSSVSYDEYFSPLNGKISHDHVLLLAHRMFCDYPKLSDILKDTFNCVFIDEYQDTDPKVVDIFSKQINQSNKNCTVGFFGDPMQAIYDNSIGSLEAYHNLNHIYKQQNRRNPQKIIDIANELRATEDGIFQEPSNDNNAPNILEGNVIEGEISFIYANDLAVLEGLKNSILFNNWNFDDGEETKELRLTQKFNATQSGFNELYNLYHKDDIYYVIDEIRKKVKKGDLDPTDQTFEELALEANITRGSGRSKVSLIEEIARNSLYSPYFSLLKCLPWTDNVEKIRIDKDSLLSYKFDGESGTYKGSSKRDKILTYLDKMYELISLYRNEEYNEFLRKTNYRINNFNDKRRLYEEMSYFENLDNKLIHEVFCKGIDLFNMPLDEHFNHYIANEGRYLWERIKNISFNSYLNSIYYQKQFFPHATQHSIKGSEYDNVLVVLDNGNWNHYNFNTLFIEGSNENVTSRTKKLFYVCCTRSKNNLVIFMPTNEPQVIEAAKSLFGHENVHNGNTLLRELME